jgi:acetylornithine deacetylase/succinyl-diaminopimelate desuccinylase-like protein
MEPTLPEAFFAEALELFRGLLRIDTTNPPGREKAAAEYLAQSLREDGLEPRLFDAAPERTSLVVRLKGSGHGPPLMLSAHLDVVPADAAAWRHPPFGAVIEDGWLYGRGAIDMKNMAAMSVMVLKALHRQQVPLDRDLIFAAVADEEAGCALGSQYLVDHHPDEVRAEYVLGEQGAFTQVLNGRRLYPIQVAQKGSVWLRASTEGAPGHGSMPRQDNAVLALCAALAKLTPNALPLHPTASARRFIRALAAAQPLAARTLMPLLLNPRFSDRMLARIPDPGSARAINAILRNTATPTVLRAGDKTNVIPARAEAELDGRILPGQRPEDLLRELTELLGPTVKLEVLRTMPPVEASSDTPMFEHLAAAIPRLDPEGVAVPFIIPGFTDAEPFCRLGATWYGFSPVWFPPEPRASFAELFHGIDERIPVEGFHRGLACLYQVVRSWCAAP